MAKGYLINSADTYKPQSAVSVASEATVWDPGANNKFRIQGAILSGDVAGNYVFKDNTAGTTIMVIPLQANVPQAFDFGNTGILSAARGNKLTCTGPTNSHLSGTIYGITETGDVTA